MRVIDTPFFVLLETSGTGTTVGSRMKQSRRLRQLHKCVIESHYIRGVYAIWYTACLVRMELFHEVTQYLQYAYVIVYNYGTVHVIHMGTIKLQV